MKLKEPVNPNYAAVVVKLPVINILPNCDNVVGAPIMGYQCIVGKNTNAGDIGILFPPEVQLSHEFCRYNNLYRHGDLNEDETAKGYIEDNRRVKAIKFRGHQSNALFMPLSSIEWTGVKASGLEEGMVFDSLNGKEICRKYVLKSASNVTRNRVAQPKKFNRVDTRHIPEHLDSDNYFRNHHKLGYYDQVVVTQKLHGTSVRIGNTFVKRKLNWKERLAKRFGVQVKETEFDYVYGSRRVIKDVNNPYSNHFYGTDVWSEAGERLKSLLPEGCIVYGELIGHTSDGAEIQKGYSYNVPKGIAELYVYRVSLVNERGFVVDLSWDQVKQFCTDRGLKHVPELWRGFHGHFVVEPWLDVRFGESFSHAVPVAQGKVDEGVCVRFDKDLIPYILKAKSPIFLNYESKLLDEGVADLETVGSEVE